jgi:hypothetical protein
MIGNTRSNVLSSGPLPSPTDSESATMLDFLKSESVLWKNGVGGTTS